MATPKEYVKQRYPHAIEVYRLDWSKLEGAFVKHYTVCLDNEVADMNGLPFNIGSGMTSETAWANAMFNIKVR